MGASIEIRLSAFETVLGIREGQGLCPFSVKFWSGGCHEHTCPSLPLQLEIALILCGSLPRCPMETTLVKSTGVEKPEGPEALPSSSPIRTPNQMSLRPLTTPRPGRLDGQSNSES
jgi:hypothetical protein